MSTICSCFYSEYKKGGGLYSYCSFISKEGKQLDADRGIYSYLSISMMSDIYLTRVIQEHLNIINQAEINHQETFYGGGQNFCLEFHNNQVVFACNEFDAEDGWPELSCSLSFFKNALLAWQAFLQLPKSIHTKLETVLDE